LQFINKKDGASFIVEEMLKRIEWK
jgi:hypothetical protein